MEELTQRTQQVIESLTENEALTDNLDDAAADELLNWGIATGKTVVQSTVGLTDEAADAAMQPHLQATRRLLRSVNNYFAPATAPTTRAAVQPDHEALLTLLRQTTEQAALIWGPRFHPPDEQQLAIVATQLQNEASTPQALIIQLRQFVDQQLTTAPAVVHQPQSVAAESPPTTDQPVVPQTPWMKRLLQQLRRFYPQQQQ